ncbi:MAG: creatininase family protein [Flavonifractor plautii]
MRLSNLTWPKAEEYFRAHDTVLIGIGSIECHGRHMPLGTDTLIPDFLLDKIEQKSDVLICPTIPYGATESLCDYPGTINLGTESALSGARPGVRQPVPARRPPLRHPQRPLAETSSPSTGWAMTSSAGAVSWLN